MHNKIKIRKILAALLLFLVPASVSAQGLAVDPAFNPNKIIDDSVFTDTQTFGDASGIQKFLESKNSILANTSPDFLQKLKEPTIVILKQALDDPRPNLGRLRTAAELIWDASQASGLNPQVIIVKLQKEQGLITNRQNDAPERLQRALDFSLGFGCPDSTGCKDSLFPGFYFQLFGNLDTGGNRYVGAAKSLMRSFNTEGGRGPSVNGTIARVGDVITLDNTLGGYEGILGQQSIQLANKATAALYRYTPHVFNGNYNFWRYFNEWFRYPNGTLIKLGGDVNTYIIQNGYRMLLPNFVAQARKLDINKTITVSSNEISSYPQGKILGPDDNTVVKVDGDPQTYVFINNVKRPASSFVLTQRGLTDSNALSMSASESQLFEQGQVLTPKDGSVIRGEKKPEIYLVENGNLKLFSSYTFTQRKISKAVQIIPDSEINSYPKFGFVAPLDGTIVKSSKANTVYFIEGGLKKPISAVVFKNRGFKNSQVVTLSEEEVSGLPIGAYTTPKERSVFKAGNGTLYLFKDGQKHYVSSFVSKQRKITADFQVPEAEAQEWSDGVPIPPADNTIVKGDKSQAVYIVQKSQLRPLTAATFKKRKISAKNIKVLPQEEVDNYAKGDTLAK